MTYKYEDCKPIDIYPAQAWLVESEGKRYLHLFAPECPFDHVHNSISNHYKQFFMMRVDVGRFELTEGNNHSSYSGDAREVNEKKEMVFRP